MMLRQQRVPGTLYLGIARNGYSGLAADGWLCCGQNILTGKAGPENDTFLACYGEKI
jgi:hypothetical protein